MLGVKHEVLVYELNVLRLGLPAEHHVQEVGRVVQVVPRSHRLLAFPDPGMSGDHRSDLRGQGNALIDGTLGRMVIQSRCGRAIGRDGGTQHIHRVRRLDAFDHTEHGRMDSAGGPESSLELF